MRGEAEMLERYARRLESGAVTVPEVASAVLEMLAESRDRAGLWSSAPPALRVRVLQYVAEVGAANIPPAFWLGPGERNPARRAAHTARRRELAAELLADAEPGTVADRGNL